MRAVDQRYYQIALLSALLVYGKFFVNIPHLSTTYILVVLGTAQLTQWICSRIYGLRYEPRSALISSISTCILLNTNALWIGALASLIMVLSKFLIRVRGGHIFNPSNIAIVACVLLFPQYAAITPGQWGPTAAWVIIAIAGWGIVVTESVKRYDVAAFFVLGFIGGWAVASLLGYRSMLQLPHTMLTIPFVLFTFYMITDPMTIPRSAIMRMYYGAFVGLSGVFTMTIIHLHPGFIYALAALSPLVPLINKIYLPQQSKPFSWRSQ
jgi:Na+-transporting NADH:ubiquinone oxidoreductase subunit NqrB